MIGNDQHIAIRIADFGPSLHCFQLPQPQENVTIASMENLTRRAAIAALAATAAAPALARKPRRKKTPPVETAPFDDIGARILTLLPETATYAGTSDALDGGPLARRTDDYSPSGEAALRAEFKASQDLLARIRIGGDSPAAIHLGSVSALLENGTRSAAIPYGRLNPMTFTGHLPYLVNQISGPHIDTVSAMMEQQSLSSARAVDAWLEKLDGFPATFAAVAEKLKADRAAGCIPPKALLAKTLPVLDAFMAGKPGDHPLVQALARRTDEAGLSRRIRQTAIRRATQIVQRRARPALLALRQEVAAMLPLGRDEAGVWALPMGEALYAANVRGQGDTSLSPDEIHKLGLDEASRIAGQMNAILARLGYRDGPIGVRMAALSREKANLFPDSDAGRTALLDYVRAKVRDAEAITPRLLPDALIPRQSLIVKPVPKATQDSAPGGFYDGPSLDGTRPGTYWINLRDMTAVSKVRLSTLSYHEGVPGHHTQGSIAAALPDIPLLIRVCNFNAHQEGWALYAEQLMAELGVYENDPMGDLGRLQDELFRAVRLVVDTGIHHKRWTREQAIRTMLDITGVSESRVTSEIERYMAWPGQALGYKLGMIRLLDMRTRYLAKKGNDLISFHAGVLGGGSLPLDLVERRLGLT
jgi:uncharacterized protein (DUF885 family)